MADIRIKDLAVTAGSSASDDYLAVDGSTNGTRKLSAYSPTFGGNLTVSGTVGTGKITVSSANLRLSNSYYLTGNLVAGTEIPLIGRNSSDKVAIDPDGYGTSIGGNLTVSGTGTSSVAGGLTLLSSKLAFADDGTNINATATSRRLQLIATGSSIVTGYNTDFYFSNETSVAKYNGNLLIGTTIDGGQKLQVSGTVAATTGAPINAFIARYNSANSLFGITLNSSGQAVLSENCDANTYVDSYSKTGLPAFRLGNVAGSVTVPFWIDVAASGTAGNAITWTNAFKIDTSQNATFAGSVKIADVVTHNAKNFGTKASGSAYTVATVTANGAGKIKMWTQHNDGDGYIEYSYVYSTNAKALSLINQNQPYGPSSVTLTLNNSTGEINTSVLSYNTTIRVEVEVFNGTTTL